MRLYKHILLYLLINFIIQMLFYFITGYLLLIKIPQLFFITSFVILIFYYFNAYLDIEKVYEHKQYKDFSLYYNSYDKYSFLNNKIKVSVISGKYKEYHNPDITFKNKIVMNKFLYDVNTLDDFLCKLALINDIFYNENKNTFNNDLKRKILKRKRLLKINKINI